MSIMYWFNPLDKSRLEYLSQNLSCIRESISFDSTHQNEELCVPGFTRT